mmetsp:Transcript_47885/g.101748  ORF Transcript_47885/g.101748 Transcript_47885/m.101748 type:complete len:200 (-) Transcript_47885:425-1024(-)
MGGNRVLPPLLSVCGVIVLWSYSSGRSIRPMSWAPMGKADTDMAESLLDWKGVNVLSSSGHEAVHENLDEPKKRSLLRTENKKLQEEGEGDKIQILPTAHLLGQIWIPNPIRGDLREGINKGLFNVLIVFIIWFAFMCSIGGAMRCYLCCETMRTDPNYTLWSLYDSFADRESLPAFDNETEGIALDSIRSTDGESNDD